MTEHYHVPAGVNIAQPVSTASLAATIAHLATGHSDPSFELPPLDALWTAPAPASWPSPMSELAPLPLDPRSRNHDTPLRSITTAKWYCVVGDGRIEVFNPADEAVGVNAFRNDPVLRTFLEMDRLDKPPADASHVAQAQPDSRSATNR